MEPSPELLEKLRRSGIRIDREGELIHEGEPFRHEGLRRALFRWLDRLDDGRYVLRLDERRFAYLDVEDTPLVVRALRVDDAGGGVGGLGAGAEAVVTLQLSDGAEERLEPRTLTVDDAGILRCWVRGGRLEARLATSAAAAIADRITETPQGPALALGPGPPRLLAQRRGSPP
jgi:hypothetical protein